MDGWTPGESFERFAVDKGVTRMWIVIHAICTRNDVVLAARKVHRVEVYFVCERPHEWSGTTHPISTSIKLAILPTYLDRMKVAA